MQRPHRIRLGVFPIIAEEVDHDESDQSQSLPSLRMRDWLPTKGARLLQREREFRS
jgi:hypothetical protein